VEQAFFCAPAYAQGNCNTYVQGTVVAWNGDNWTCSNGNCANCAIYSSCAPGGSGCPWGVVWTDNGVCGGSSDTTPPTAPTNVTAGSITSSGATLSWTASTDNVGVTGYKIYNGSTLLASPTSTSSNIGGLSAGTAYTLTVKATDAAGNLSAGTNVSFTTTAASDTTPSTAPTNVIAGSITSSGATLSWTASTDNVGVTGYRIYNGSTLLSSPTSTSANVSNLTASTTYTLTVKAIDAAGNLSGGTNVSFTTSGSGGGPNCAAAYAQGNCNTYVQGTVVSTGGHNWTCSNGNCANCAVSTNCAPGGSGCPWGVVWTDNGTCQ